MSTAAHQPILYLDHEWRPLRVESWTRAISDFCLGKVEVIEYSKDHKIRGVTREYPMPVVVRVLKRFKREKIRIKFSRLNIYARDKFVCQYCHVRKPTEDLTFDHVLPKSRGGRTSWENIVTCCVDAPVLSTSHSSFVAAPEVAVFAVASDSEPKYSLAETLLVFAACWKLAVTRRRRPTTSRVPAGIAQVPRVCSDVPEVPVTGALMP